MHEAPTAAAPTSRSRWATTAWIACSALLVILVVGVWMKVGNDRAGANLANAIISGERPVAPALPSEDLAGDGAPGLPSWYRAPAEGRAQESPGARILVVNWWASWCGPCKDEAPVLAEVARDYEGRVDVIGLNAGNQDLKRDAAAFVRTHELEDLAIVRGDRRHEDAWGVHNFPETFVVGTDGRISSFVPGPIDEETLRGLIDAELDEERT